MARYEKPPDADKFAEAIHAVLRCELANGVTAIAINGTRAEAPT